ncbi:hypothetical protein GC163_24175 [bacterium]|nr:hypothetical protein [bacterium]
MGWRLAEPVGFWSLYTPRRDRPLVGHQPGWVAANRGRDAWGTQMMCFPRASAELLLSYRPLYEENQLRGPTDAIVAQCFRDAGYPCYYHNPSLVDHLGKVSAMGNNWQTEHVGLDFDQDYAPSPQIDPANEEPTVSVASSPRTAVVTVYQDNLPREVLEHQEAVVQRWLPSACDFERCRVGHHALGLDDYFRQPRHAAYLILDADCIPLADWVIPWMLSQAQAGVVVGAAQRANHLKNDQHIYAGPCALAFSRATWDRLSPISFTATERGDVAEELTYRCEQLGIPITLLWPTDVVTPRWTLHPNQPFGLGTTYANALFHAFEISKGQTVPLFLRKCQEVITHAAQANLPTTVNDQQVRNVSTDYSRALPCGQFHEVWYSDAELARLTAAVQGVSALQGAIVELGCWEGRSTVAMAQACTPEMVLAVDTWEGNRREDSHHVTVRLARERNIHHTFVENIQSLTAGNVQIYRQESASFLAEFTGRIKFCHMDADHDYHSVRQTLLQLLPRLVPGAVLFGHDYATAHCGRDDLQGGVERAVCEILPNHVAIENTWWYLHTNRVPRGS